MKKRTVLKAVFIALSVILLAFIYVMSSKPAEESQKISLSVDYRLVRLLVPGFDGLPEEEKQVYASQADHFVRKSAHFAEFAALGALLTTVFMLFDIKRYKCLLLALLSGAAAAAADEIHQLFVPGRAGMITDFLLDCAGVLSGCFVVILISVIINAIKTKKVKANKKE